MSYLTSKVGKAFMSKSIFATLFQLLIAAVVLAVFGVSDAMSQMTYGVNYSDTWMVAYNQPWTDEDGYEHPSESGDPYVAVCGYGAVDGSAASYSHYYSPLTVTLTSPNGRTSNSENSGGGYLRADVSLTLIEAGDYYTTHHESGYCPGCNCSHVIGGGGSAKRIGVSFSAYYKAVQVDPYRAVYQLVTPCDVNCVFYPSGSSQRFSLYPSPNYLRIGEPWVNIAGYIICETAIASLEESATPLYCYEL
jgi:hypothetical protein